MARSWLPPHGAATRARIQPPRCYLLVVQPADLPVRLGAILMACLLVGLILVGGPISSACATDGAWVWVDDLSPGALAPPPYRVMPGDRLVVSVWNQPAISGEVLVRPDGRITLPLVGDIAVLGLTPPEVGIELARHLEGLVVDPRVAVGLGGNRSPTVAIMGEVRQAGAFELRPGDGVLDVIAQAGGLSEFANRSRVFVLRRGQDRRVRFDYDRLSRLSSSGIRFLLQDGDVVVVE